MSIWPGSAENLASELPQITAYFQSGGLVDAVLNLGLPAPIDVQVSGIEHRRLVHASPELARQSAQIPGVSDVYMPQDIDYPALQLDMDRLRAGPTRPHPAGSDQQRDHGAHFEPDDRAELLGRSQKPATITC